MEPPPASLPPLHQTSHFVHECKHLLLNLVRGSLQARGGAAGARTHAQDDLSGAGSLQAGGRAAVVQQGAQLPNTHLLILYCDSSAMLESASYPPPRPA
eukprot:1145822-Pelagomonas_calceolata.AAC.3